MPIKTETFGARFKLVILSVGLLLTIASTAIIGLLVTIFMAGNQTQQAASASTIVGNLLRQEQKADAAFLAQLAAPNPPLTNSSLLSISQLANPNLVIEMASGPSLLSYRAGVQSPGVPAAWLAGNNLTPWYTNQNHLWLVQHAQVGTSVILVAEDLNPRLHTMESALSTPQQTITLGVQSSGKMEVGFQASSDATVVASPLNQQISVVIALNPTMDSLLPAILAGSLGFLIILLLALSTLYFRVDRDLRRPLAQLDLFLADLANFRFDSTVPRPKVAELATIATHLATVRDYLHQGFVLRTAQSEISALLNRSQKTQQNLVDILPIIQRITTASTVSLTIAAADIKPITFPALSPDQPWSADPINNVEFPIEQSGIRLGTLTLTLPTPLAPEIFPFLEIVIDQLGTALQRDNLQRHLALDATTDSITGLANRRAFDSALRTQTALALRSHQPLSLLMFDLDHFKILNDTLGHPAGDKALKRVSSLLAQRARAGDLAARYGGEELVLLLPNTTAKDMKLLAEELRAAIQELGIQASKDTSAVLTTSVGGATLPVHADTAKTLLDQADVALYQAKSAGRNCCRFPESLA